MIRSSTRANRNANRPAADPRVVAVFCPDQEGYQCLVAKKSMQGLEVLATRHFSTSEGGASAWTDELLAARRVVVLPSSGVVVRAVHLPPAPEDKLLSALGLNSTTFVLGRTPAHRVACGLLAGERGEERMRTGLVAEWPVEQEMPALPMGITERDNLSFAPEAAALAALVASSQHPMLAVDADRGAVTVAAPTTKGVLVRVVRASAEEGAVDADEIAFAVGEACVHAGVPAAEITAAVAETRRAAADALGGGFGCTPETLKELNSKVRLPAGAGGDDWWREHGVAVGVALAALGALVPLTRLQSCDLGARPDRAGELLNRMGDKRVATRLMVGAVVVIAFGPMVFQGLRLLVLRWKLPDVVAYEKQEAIDKQKRALYGMLSRNAASVTKTLADLGAATPDGIDVEFINITQSAKGEALTVRGKARPAGGKEGTEAILAMEEMLGKTGVFDNITRSSEPPDQRGYQDFTITAVAPRATELAHIPRDRDFSQLPMRVIRYGPPPADIDLVASGITAEEAEAYRQAMAGRTSGGASAGSASAGSTSGGSTAPPAAAGSRPAAATAAAGHPEEASEGEPSTARSGAASSAGTASGPGTASMRNPRSGTPTSTRGAAHTPEAGSAEAKAADGKTADGKTTDGKTADGKTADGKPADGKAAAGAPGAGAAGAGAAGAGAAGAGAAGAGAPAGGAEGDAANAADPAGRAAATKQGGRPAAQRHGSGLGGTSDGPEPPPPPLSEAEINAMSKAEAQATLVTVAKARNRQDLDDEVKARLRKEFDLLIERCKRD